MSPRVTSPMARDLLTPGQETQRTQRGGRETGGLVWRGSRPGEFKSAQKKEVPSHSQTRNNFLCLESIHQRTLITQSAKVTELILYRQRLAALIPGGTRIKTQPQIALSHQSRHGQQAGISLANAQTSKPNRQNYAAS